MLRQRQPREKVFKKKNSPTKVCHLVINECSSQISRKSVNSTYPIAMNSFEDEGFCPKRSASFRSLKIFKHVTPCQRDMSTQKAASQWHKRTPSVHSKQNRTSRERDCFTVTFSLFSFCAHVLGRFSQQWAKCKESNVQEKKKKKRKAKRNQGSSADAWFRRHSWPIWNPWVSCVLCSQKSLWFLPKDLSLS